jgi:hypothetical protein
MKYLKQALLMVSTLLIKLLFTLAIVADTIAGLFEAGAIMMVDFDSGIKRVKSIPKEVVDELFMVWNV